MLTCDLFDLWLLVCIDLLCLWLLWFVGFWFVVLMLQKLSCLNVMIASIYYLRFCLLFVFAFYFDCLIVLLMILIVVCLLVTFMLLVDFWFGLCLWCFVGCLRRFCILNRLLMWTNTLYLFAVWTVWLLC